jgi:(E)-4-hydroxy-3-methylbut-2-enyl-diphosphate synthase
MNTNQTYCNSLTTYSRFQTRVVQIGDLALGGNNPIRVQSMTTTDTMDTLKTVEQSIRMIEAGCELVRITAPSINEANNLQNIKDELRKRGFNTPLVADIHFTPNAAEAAARIVEKVRVNPGNYADKKKFTELEYTDATYDAELERIRERFSPLVKICKEYGTAMRIGTNHGSLSDRILSRYGDTPLGMVESAMEFLRICRDLNYHEIVLSMKASNPQVMVQAYRLLVSQMISLGWDYPLHLGVTEAGEGEDGRIKSAVGIGTLLEDGLGDTVRVSLTEDPEFEIPVALDLVNRYSKPIVAPTIKPFTVNPINPFYYSKRKTDAVQNIGGHSVPRVVGDLSHFVKKSPMASISPANLFGLGYAYSVEMDKWNLAEQAVDYVYLADGSLDFEIPGTLGVIINSGNWKMHQSRERFYPLFCGSEIFDEKSIHPELNFVAVDLNILKPDYLEKIKSFSNVVLVLETMHPHGMLEQRRAFSEVSNYGIQIPIIIKRNYSALSENQFQLYSSTDCGALLLDGLGDGIWLNAAETAPPKMMNSTAFGILQATRTRISKTEYISCPSCGRTLFDLQETTSKIRSRTEHLKGVKIGIMGCIVNGPGEMADADYGYVGTGVGKITLYKGKEVVKRNVPSEKAVEELVGLIKEGGDWVDV